MKTVKIVVEVSVPDNYVIDEPNWLIEDIVLGRETDCNIENTYILKNN